MSAPPPPYVASSNVTRLIWDAASASCTALSVDPSSSVQANCCSGGMFQRNDLPRRGGEDVWIPIVWCVILCWIFVPGVAMGADVFMTSIEVITAAEYTVVRKVGGVDKVLHLRVWNDTVANLTLMALGSSAPEILLSIIEIVGGKFHAGALGPSTIVGSAAFNLMIITGVCMCALPEGETRTISQLGVFLVTSAYSIFAYIWLLIIIVVWTPNVVTIEEGVITVLFLFLLVAQVRRPHDMRDTRDMRRTRAARAPPVRVRALACLAPPSTPSLAPALRCVWPHHAYAHASSLGMRVRLSGLPL
jgi:hypothetical protein